MIQQNFTHHFLIPSQQMDDERFTDALIYICRHNADGAWGFIINQPLTNVSVGGLLNDLDIPSSQKTMSTQAMNGGPMRPEAGFVLHTGQPNYKSSFAISENICLTTSKDILEKLSIDGVSHYLLCMGYCSWGKKQLEREIANGDWFVCPADLQTLFVQPFSDRLPYSRNKLGVKPERLVDFIGNA